ncbi:hypothetical protein CTA2_10628 [Colletotrichum tanaceti]|nr:hypothetical protein CTA2_10628 [Colletotrichum tanaceti]
MARGAKAHRSHEVPSHSNVISAKFFAGKTRVVSGHIHLDGTVDYGRPRGNTGSDREEGPSTRNSGNRPESGESSAWKPAREYVDTGNWTIYDSDKRKTREVREENGWWYIETRKGKVYF